MLASLGGIVNLGDCPLRFGIHPFFWPHLDKNPTQCASKRLHEECNGN